MPPQSTPRYHSPADVAAIYGVKVAKVLAWIGANELRAVNVATRRGGSPRWRISPEALAEFETARQSTPPAVKQSRQPRRQMKIVEYVK